MRGNYADLATLLARGISQQRMYFEGHPNVKQCATEFVDLLGRLLAEDEASTFLLGVVEGKLVHDGRYLVGSTVVGRQLTSFADLLETGRARIDAGHLTAAARQRYGVTTLADPDVEHAAAGRQQFAILFAQRGSLGAEVVGVIGVDTIHRFRHRSLLDRSGHGRVAKNEPAP